jgi:hypothetical protein
MATDIAEKFPKWELMKEVAEQDPSRITCYVYIGGVYHINVWNEEKEDTLTSVGYREMPMSDAEQKAIDLLDELHKKVHSVSFSDYKCQGVHANDLGVFKRLFSKQARQCYALYLERNLLHYRTHHIKNDFLNKLYFAKRELKSLEEVDFGKIHEDAEIFHGQSRSLSKRKITRNIARFTHPEDLLKRAVRHLEDIKTYKKKYETN